MQLSMDASSRPGPARRAVVIGGGFGGLALAVRLQSAGIATTLVEARDKLGGRAYVYEQDGFTFDAGPTVITDPSALEELFALSGRQLGDYVTLLPVEPFYRLMWEDGRRFDYVNDQAALDREITAFEPADVEGYRRFLAYSTAAFEEGYLRLGHVPFLDFKSMLAAAPKLAQMQAWRSVYDTVARFIRNEHLRQAFSFHTLLVGGSPFAVSSIYALIHALERKWGVWFPKGGTGALVAGLARLFTDLGGGGPHRPRRWRRSSPRACAPAACDSRPARCWRPISSPPTGTSCTPTAPCSAIMPAGAPRLRGLKAKRFSMSLFVTYFGCRKTWEGLQHHTILFGESYRELVGDICGAKPLRADFSLYLHAPTVTDPGLAPQGCTGFYVLSPVPNLKQDIDWTREAGPYADRVLEALERRLLPGPARDPRHTPDLHPLRLPRRAERPPGVGLLAGADLDPERLLPHPQPRRHDQEPLFRRRGDPSGRRRTRRGGLGQGDGGRDPGRPGAMRVARRPCPLRREGS